MIDTVDALIKADSGRAQVNICDDEVLHMLKNTWKYVFSNTSDPETTVFILHNFQSQPQGGSLAAQLCRLQKSNQTTNDFLLGMGITVTA